MPLCWCTIKNENVALLDADLSCDENSPVWMATLSISSLDSFSKINIFDPVLLYVHDETNDYNELYRLFVDGKTLNIDNNDKYVISCLSPLALKDKPYSESIDVDKIRISARGLVESLVGDVVWSLEDWIIPQIEIVASTPLEIVRNITNAVGGLIESAADGSIVCRYKHAENPKQYTIGTTHYYDDGELFGISEQLRNVEWFNSIVVSNEKSDNGLSDVQVEVDMNDDGLSGTIRAYFDGTDSATLTHSGNYCVSIGVARRFTETKSETIEFVEGAASTKYPIYSLVSAEWRYDNLGSVTFTGKEVKASVGGYSLLLIKYLAKCVEWDVSNPCGEETQFILMR